MSEGEAITRETLVLQPGTLWAKVKQRTEQALRLGALQTIPTKYEFVEQNGIPFLVRIASNLRRKDEDKQQQEKKISSAGKEFNPFLPYEQELFVTDISKTHLCLLNKFNVADYHLLIVTREFEEQENWLNQQDFAAMWAMSQFDGLTFYNAGKIAGASQRHKHLQLVPLPLAPAGVKIPIERAIASACFQGSVGTIPDFPFVHAITRLDSRWAESPLEAAKATLECYQTLLGSVGLLCNGDGNRQTSAYNLLATREWMLIIPRSQESFESISVNSLGFAGTFFVRNEQQLNFLKDYGPLNFLQKVANSVTEFE